MGNLNRIKRHRIVYSTQSELNESDKKIERGILVDSSTESIYEFNLVDDDYDYTRLIGQNGGSALPDHNLHKKGDRYTVCHPPFKGTITPGTATLDGKVYTGYVDDSHAQELGLSAGIGTLAGDNDIAYAVKITNFYDIERDKVYDSVLALSFQTEHIPTDAMSIDGNSMKEGRDIPNSYPGEYHALWSTIYSEEEIAIALSNIGQTVPFTYGAEIFEGFFHDGSSWISIGTHDDNSNTGCSIFTIGEFNSERNMGGDNKIRGDANNIRGHNNDIRGDANDVSGQNITIAGNQCLAKGSSHNIMGYGGISVGAGIVVDGDSFLAIGDQLIIDDDNQMAIGRYNIPDGEAVFIAGNGDSHGRSNAAVLKKNGQMTLPSSQIASAIDPKTVATVEKVGAMIISPEEKERLAGLSNYISPHFDDTKKTFVQNDTNNAFGDYSSAGGFKAKAQSFSERALGGSPTEVIATENTTFSGTVETQRSEFATTANTIGVSNGKTSPFIHTSIEENKRYGYCEATVYGQSLSGSSFVDRIVFLVDFSDYTTTLISTDEKHNNFDTKPTYSLAKEANDGGLAILFSGVENNEIIYTVNMDFTIVARAKSLSDVFGLSIKAGATGVDKLPDSIDIARLKNIFTVSGADGFMPSLNYFDISLEVVVLKIVSLESVLSIIKDSTVGKFRFDDYGIANTWKIYKDDGSLLMSKENYAGEEEVGVILNNLDNLYMVIVPTSPNATMYGSEQTLTVFPALISGGNGTWQTLSPQESLAEEWKKFGIKIPKLDIVMTDSVFSESLVGPEGSIDLTRYKEADTTWMSYSEPLPRGEYVASASVVVDYQEEIFTLDTEITIPPWIKHSQLSESPIAISSTTNGLVGGVSKAVNLSTIDDLNAVAVVPVSTNRFSFTHAHPDHKVDFDENGVKANMLNLVSGASNTWGTVTNTTVSASASGENGDETDTIGDFDIPIEVAIDADILEITQFAPCHNSKLSQLISFNLRSHDISVYENNYGELYKLNEIQEGSVIVNSSDDSIIEMGETAFIPKGQTGESATVTATFTHPISGVTATGSILLTIEVYLASVLANMGLTVAENYYGVGVGVPLSFTLIDNDGNESLLDLSMANIVANSSDDIIIEDGKVFVLNSDGYDMYFNGEDPSGEVRLDASTDALGLATQLYNTRSSFPIRKDATSVSFTQDNALVVGDNVRSFSCIFGVGSMNYAPINYLNYHEGLSVSIASPAEVTLLNRQTISVPSDLPDGTEVVIDVEYTHPITGVSVSGQHSTIYHTV